MMRVFAHGPDKPDKTQGHPVPVPPHIAVASPGPPPAGPRPGGFF
jgi:hypothetical protein